MEKSMLKTRMNNQAGKGPEIRKGANLRAYWDNYDSIFRKERKIDLHVIATGLVEISDIGRVTTMLKNYADEATKEDDRDMIELVCSMVKG